jgi:hypothetical protein
MMIWKNVFQSLGLKIKGQNQGSRLGFVFKFVL